MVDRDRLGSGRVLRRFLFVLLLAPLLTCASVDPAPPPPPVPSVAPPIGSQWITVNKDYSSQRYVDLDQITPENVGALQKICELELNTASWFSSGLLMVDDTLYVNTLGYTYALDAATCAPKWRYKIQFKHVLAGVSNRGSAYLDQTLFRGTADGQLIAIDAKTGTLKWATQGANPWRVETFTAAPIAWDGKVFIGIGTSDYGIRGRLAAFDAATGKELWRFHTIPYLGQRGSGTWPVWPFGPWPRGGGFWTSFSLDPATGEVFGPVANPNPDYKRDTWGRANLFTNSVISLNGASGRLNWFYQTIAGDTHDWDLGTAPTLYRTKSGREMLAITGKEGFVFGLDRAGSVSDPRAMGEKPCVFKTPGTTTPPTASAAGDPCPPTLEPAVDDTLRLVCPGSIGGAQWNGTAYHPELGILYSGMVDNCFWYSTKSYGQDGRFWAPEGLTVRVNFSTPPSGWITAMDGETGKVLWKYHTEAQVLAGLVPTKGGLLFAGDVQGNLLVFDAKDGRVLKTIDAEGALNHGLISYESGGKQYVAAAVGGLTLNPSGVRGPGPNPTGLNGALRVSVFGLGNGGKPTIRSMEPRTPIAPIGQTSSKLWKKHDLAYQSICGTCHGPVFPSGFTYPPLWRHTELANDANDYQVLKDFLRDVPPPMPILYPGLLDDDDVRLIGEYLKTVLGSELNPQRHDSAPAGYIYAPPTTSGTEAWKKVYSVLTSPRCINCHTVTNYPRQRDIRYPHIYSVVRGEDGGGAPVARCTSCHGEQNDDARGIPGACGWHLAPLEMAWERSPGIAKTGPELCTMFRTLSRNQEQAMLRHLDTQLVRWAWNPGSRWNGTPRTPPPIGREEFMAAFTEWMQTGFDCPTE